MNEMRFVSIAIFGVLAAIALAMACQEETKDKDTRVLCYSVDSGELLWEQRPQVPRLSTPRYAGNRVAFLGTSECSGCNGKYCYTEEPNPVLEAIAFDMATGETIASPTALFKADAYDETVAVTSYCSSSTGEGDGVCEVVAYLIETGEEQWRFQVESGEVRVIIHLNTVVLVDRAGPGVTVLSLSSGALIWQQTFGEASRIGAVNEERQLDPPILLLVGISSHPNPLLYLSISSQHGDGSDDELFAVTANDGEVVWRADLPAGDLYGAGLVILSEVDNQLVVLSGLSGQELWRRPSPYAPRCPFSVEDNTVYVQHYQEENPDADQFPPLAIQALDLITGVLKWERALERVDNGGDEAGGLKMVPLSGRLYLKSGNDLEAVNAQNGDTHWSITMPNDLHMSALLYTEAGVVLYGRNYQMSNSCIQID